MLSSHYYVLTEHEHRANSWRLGLFSSHTTNGAQQSAGLAVLVAGRNMHQSCTDTLCTLHGAVCVIIENRSQLTVDFHFVIVRDLEAHSTGQFVYAWWTASWWHWFIWLGSLNKRRVCRSGSWGQYTALCISAVRINAPSSSSSSPSAHRKSFRTNSVNERDCSAHTLNMEPSSWSDSR